MHLHDAVRAGKLLMVTVGEPGVHGVVTGMQGWGVKTPKAAAVAAATCGLLGDMHIPNVGMLDMGAKSIIVAAGVPQVVVGAEVALSTAGAAPIVHIICAPVTTSCPIRKPLLTFSSQISIKI
jgi:hypothetical protein